MVRILTDSSSDISPALAKELGVDIVPLNVTTEDGQVYQDGVNLPMKDFWSMLAACKQLPKTSQPSPQWFIDYFAAAKEAGDETVVLLISAGLSGTYQCARLCAEDAEYEDVYFVDTQTACIGLRLLINQAIARRNEGMSASQIAEELEERKKYIRILLIAEDLKHLHKGGRLSTAATIAGGALGIKPVLQLWNNKLGAAVKARGLPGAYVALFKEMEKFGGMNRELPYFVAYTDKPQAAEPIVRYLTQNQGLPEQKPVTIGAAIGTHIGPGACGIAYFTNEKAE